jgi:hypothetical protein
LIERLQQVEKIKKKCDDDKTSFQWRREIDNSFEEN